MKQYTLTDTQRNFIKCLLTKINTYTPSDVVAVGDRYLDGYTVIKLLRNMIRTNSYTKTGHKSRTLVDMLNDIRATKRFNMIINNNIMETLSVTHIKSGIVKITID